MFTHKLLITALGIALAAGVVASPGDEEREAYYERRGPMPFEAMDLDGDGGVSADEYDRVRTERQRVRAEQGYPMRRANQASQFGQIDRDADGSIDRDELSGWQAQRLQQRGMGRGGRWDD